MVPAASHPMDAASARGTGTELVLLRPGSRADLARSLACFERIPLSLVLSPPDGEEEEWAAAFVRAHSAPHARSAELVRRRSAESDEALSARIWPVLEQTLARGHARVLAVLAHDLVRLSLACALGFPLARASGVRVDPGHLVLLRDDPIGVVLRRSNVLSPEELSGTPLPGGVAARPGQESGG
jgi:hypothetical protein